MCRSWTTSTTVHCALINLTVPIAAFWQHQSVSDQLCSHCSHPVNSSLVSLFTFTSGPVVVDRFKACLTAGGRRKTPAPWRCRPFRRSLTLLCCRSTLGNWYRCSWKMAARPRPHWKPPWRRRAPWSRWGNFWQTPSFTPSLSREVHSKVHPGKSD